MAEKSKKPNSRRNLDLAIERLSSSRDDADLFLSEEIADLFCSLGFPEPGPVPLMALPHQIAQKLHGVSEPGGERAHDLVDLQIMVSEGDVDWRQTRETCTRLFAYRRQQSWPPTISAGERWGELYEHAREGLPVLPGVDEAVAWANGLVERVDSAGD